MVQPSWPLFWGKRPASGPFPPPALPSVTEGTDPAEIQLSVLYVDASIGFGGAFKSLALTLNGLPNVTKILATSQSPEQVRTWFPKIPTWSFRRRLNYRLRESMVETAPGAFGAWIAAKLYALLDLAMTYVNAVRMWVLLRRHRVDLLHLNNGFLPPEALLAARLADLPCVVHLRDFHRDSRLLKTANVRRISSVLSVSNAVARSLGAESENPWATVTVYDPVDCSLIDAAEPERPAARRELGISEDDIAVGMFGRVIPWKGQREFVNAVIKAMRACPTITAIIVGDSSDGDPRYFAGIQETIRASGLEGRFRLTGYRTDVERLYWAMDVVVHASITPEPFGMVVPEAMAAKRAVIAADAGGPCEIVTAGVDGILVSPIDTDALSSAIVALATDQISRERLGEAARQTIDRRFTTLHNQRAVADVYRRVIGFGKKT
jgi:glycosyltransferase involved in cell wall biosynthesis